ncbi:MAG: NADPH:quinone oxidoreductase family protein [Acidobacteriota bacterium]
MRAVQLHGFEGIKSLKLVDIGKPQPGEGEVLIAVKAAGMNYAEVEQIHGKYPTFGKEVPFVMGFEAAGVVVDTGAGVTQFKAGDPVAALVSSGGYAEFAIAPAQAVIPLPTAITFPEATTIPIQGMTAYTILKYLVMPVAHESLLIQAAAGGVGLYLVQIAKLFGIKNVIALASSDEKLELVKTLGADVVINYSKPAWAEKVRQSTQGQGVDVVLQMSSDKVGEESFKLTAPGGRIVLFGAKNYHDSISTEQVRQLIWQNQSLVGFAYPALPPERIAESLPDFLKLIEEKKVKIFANQVFPFSQAPQAFEALSSRQTIGKVVLTPES